jgi:RHS repeat-associated protein
LLTDHLGSTMVTASGSGEMTGEVRYMPWGEDRYTFGTTPTSFTFTGQRVERCINLMWYNSRWYDDELGRFIQPDSIVPGIGGSGNPNTVEYLRVATYSPLVVDYRGNEYLGQLNSENRRGLQFPNLKPPPVPISNTALDRFAYSLNNPVLYTDPSGHCIWDLCIVEGIGLVELGILAVATIATTVAVTPGTPEAFAQSVMDFGDSVSQSMGKIEQGLSGLLIQYRYRGDPRKAQDIIGQEKKGSINQEFPSEMLGKTSDEINELARQGEKAAQKAQKLLGTNDLIKTRKGGARKNSIVNLVFFCLAPKLVDLQR